MPPGPICTEIVFGWIGIATTIEQGVCERPQDGFGMLPANGLQGAPTVCDVNSFMSDFAEIARTVAAHNLEDLVCARGSNEASYRGVTGRFVPIIHGFGENLARV